MSPKKLPTSQRYTIDRRKCREYLDHVLGEHILQPKLRLDASMREAYIKDIDLFHKLARACRRKELSEIMNTLYFSIRIPNDSYWSIMLERNQNHAFGEKYGRDYKARVISLCP